MSIPLLDEDLLDDNVIRALENDVSLISYSKGNKEQRGRDLGPDQEKN